MGDHYDDIREKIKDEKKSKERIFERGSKDITNEILHERSRYGDYTEMSRVILSLQAIVMLHAKGMPDPQRHALDMIMVKIGRILTGDPTYRDNWEDIQGYAKLALGDFKPEQKENAD